MIIRGGIGPFLGVCSKMLIFMSWKNDAGAWESRSEWHRCIVFGRLAEFVATLAKRAHVAVEGELRSHEYQPRFRVTG